MPRFPFASPRPWRVHGRINGAFLLVSRTGDDVALFPADESEARAEDDAELTAFLSRLPRPATWGGGLAALLGALLGGGIVVLVAVLVLRS